MDSEKFAGLVLQWYDHYGRKNLPWQQNTNPYRVWVSEIMLQQTQVSTVIPYYERFIKRFPDVGILAEAGEDELMSYWSGLGYYARARNLHKAAKKIVENYHGQLPQTSDELQSLPGIGRSTAGAILSLALDQHQAILDGNVKRVLARCFAVEGWPGKSDVLAQLWTLTEKLTPKKRTANFNQAMMDIGATVCKRTNPGCSLCPLKKHCLANQHGRADHYPGKKPRKQLPLKHATMLLLTNPQNEILVYKRPPRGIWGSLWSLPEIAHAETPATWCRKAGLKLLSEPYVYAEFRHTFSHFHLQIKALHGDTEIAQHTLMEAEERVWYKCGSDIGGMAAPVAKLLDRFWEL